MTKEELIGRKFRAAPKGEGLLHKIVDIKHYDRIGVMREPESYEKSIGEFYISDFMRRIDDGTWKLLPEESNMYKTKGGIEYGIGTQFIHKDILTHVYSVNKIEDGRVYLVWSFSKGGSTDYRQSDADIYFDEDTWIIKQPMKDYKQVDPKTIKFDFTNTKIKVNNEDESKWIQEVAFNNGKQWGFGGNTVSFTKQPYLFFSTKLITHSINKSTFDDSTKDKEITIQDILNNMKEVIEVGDTIFSDMEYVVTKIEGDRYYVKSGGYLYKDQIHRLVSKGKQKEVIGYETVVDLPGIPKGSKSNTKGAHGWLFASSTTSNQFDEGQVADTKFFKPIYKQDAIELKFSKYTATLSKEHGLVFSDGEGMNLKDVQKLIIAANKTDVNLGLIGNHRVILDVQFTGVKVGCKSFTPEDVKVVSEAIKKLD